MILIEESEIAYQTALKTFRCRVGTSNGILHSCIDPAVLPVDDFLESIFWMISWRVFSGRSIFLLTKLQVFLLAQ